MRKGKPDKPIKVHCTQRTFIFKGQGTEVNDTSERNKGFLSDERLTLET